MTPPQLDIARRAVACRGWRWMPGMLAIEWAAPGMSLTGGRPVRVDDGWHEVGVWLPDLSDPATLGCLLHLVREAWGAPRALVRLSANGKSFHVFDVDRVTANGNWAAWLCDDRIWQTEAEALVAALEAAPVAGGAR